MFVKRLFQKATDHHQASSQGKLAASDFNPRIEAHYGIPSTASILAFDHIQRLLAIGTLDGRIKLIGGDNIEGLLISSKQLPFKNLEFLQNQGFLISVTTENDIQIWNLEDRCISSSMLWESNITAFSVIYGTNYMYIGDEHGLLSVLKFDVAEGKLLHLPYQITANSIAEAAGICFSNQHSAVGVLPQPNSYGNRVLIAYENGLIILWDVSEDRIVLVRGHNDLYLKNIPADSTSDGIKQLPSDPSSLDQVDKEISSLCWVANDGSILAVGYVDGDILLWNLSAVARTDQACEKGSHDAVKLQLSSADKRLPVIVLHWYANTSHDHKGRLFVYGGDEIGSEEVLTILSLDQSSHKGTVKCVGRVDLTLNGSFADMVLLPTAGAMGSSHSTSLFVLSNPGQLYLYDDACLSTMISQQEKLSSVCAMQYPVVIPTVEPCMTVGMLRSIDVDGKGAKALLETGSNLKQLHRHNKITKGNTEWPLSGGVPILSSEDDIIKRVFIAGYSDGSVRIWDVMHSCMSLISVICSEVEGVKIDGLSEPVSALELCSKTLNLAVGNQCGVVCLYSLIQSSTESDLHIVREAEHKVHRLHKGTGTQLTAVFSLLNSPVRVLRFADFGARLAVGFECGQVAMLDTNSLSPMFVIGCPSVKSGPIISLDVYKLADPHSLCHDSERVNDLEKWVLFILTRDAGISLLDGSSGDNINSLARLKDSAAVSMYLLESGMSVHEVSDEKPAANSPQKTSQTGPALTDSVPDKSKTTTGNLIEQRLMDLDVLLCCEDSLSVFSLKPLIKGVNSSTKEVNLVKPCSSTMFFQKNEQECGLVVLYCTGAIEIRSLPDLQVVTEISLMTILRWSFKSNMDKMMGSSNTGQITLVNGFEFAVVSLMADESDSRFPESLPCLHDKVLAAAADAAIKFSQEQKKKQGVVQGILGGIVKGLKGGKELDVDLKEAKKCNIEHLEGIFTGSPEFSRRKTDGKEVVELDIDDIDIDDPTVPSSSQKTVTNRREKQKEREKLFEGATSDTRPKVRTTAEIIAKYRKAGSASEVAAQAKDKLVERQEKLERISRRTEELQDGAENFASMASELAKAMEKRSKWWNI